jgi:hypothetical protein
VRATLDRTLQLSIEVEEIQRQAVTDQIPLGIDLDLDEPRPSRLLNSRDVELLRAYDTPNSHDPTQVSAQSVVDELVTSTQDPSPGRFANEAYWRSDGACAVQSFRRGDMLAPIVLSHAVTTSYLPSRDTSAHHRPLRLPSVDGVVRRSSPS